MKFSIITPIYKTPINKLERLYKSLINQTYSNWEWVVFDDSPSNHTDSYDYIKNINDERIKLYSNDKHSGIIGEVKKKSFLLGSGDILVEVDHDDELIDTCLENLLVGYSYSDDIGFVYGHCCEQFENSNEILDYGDNWGLGYGGYITTNYKDKKYKVAIAPNINSKTVRHITGIPNHVRSWKSNFYHKIGGHNETLHVGDDYELFVRTFLNTKIVKINSFTYIQYFERDNTNTQFNKNADIQKIVSEVSKNYDEKIHNRFVELGIDDFAWNDGNMNFSAEKPEIEPYSNIIIPNNLLKNNLIKMTDKYGYSRVYNIESTLNYKQTEHYFNLIKWFVKLTNCQSYLELGVEYSTNIQEIKKLVKKCVGVDINDIPNKDGIDFYQITTDNFFKQNKEFFDIVFIDANHNFSQVKKDFNNSLKVLNEYGIIILHDTDPIIEELLAPHYCSDSYKIINYITSKYPTLNIMTFPIHETGISFVMRKSDRRIKEFMRK